MPHAELSEADSIITVRFTREEKLNAISPEMTEVLWGATRALAERDDLRAMVIAANGRYFTAGIDLRAPSAGTTATHGQEFRRLYRDHHRLYDEFEAIEKPIILAAQGPCLGAGLEMACSCDFRLASTDAVFQLPEISLGTIAGSGGTSRLTRLVGPHWGKWLAMANRSVDAQRALTIGLVHEVFAVEGFDEAVREIVKEIIALPAQALGVAKLTVDMSVDADRTNARHLERLANTQLIFSDEFKDLVRAFEERAAAKRNPAA